MPSPLALAVAAVALLETLLAVAWWQPYFRFGVVIRRDEEPLAKPVTSEVSALLLRERFGQASAVVLHQAASSALFARVKLGIASFAYTRAEIRFEPTGNRVVAVYRLAWYPIVLGAVLLVQPVLTHRPVVPRILIVTLVSLFVYLGVRHELKLLRAVGNQIAASLEGR